MRKTFVVISIVTVISIVIFGTGNPYLRLDRFGFADVDWADIVYYDNQLYDVAYISNDHSSRAIVEADMIDEQLGVVRFTLNENVGNGKYKLRNWDASFLQKGTRIFSIKNVNPKKSIAVYENGIYVEYTVSSTK